MTDVLAAGAVCRPGAPVGAGGALGPGWVAIAEGVIIDVGRDAPPRGATDLGACVLAPGYVDLQCNGVGSDDFADADRAGWRRAADTLAGHGVTSYCATLVSASLERYDVPLAVAAEMRDAPGPATSDCLGVHLEGPFLGGAPGAHDPSHLAPADASWLGDLLAHHPGLVRMVTLAPEADPSSATIRLLVAAGVTVALGHSTATYDLCRAAADAGATVATHLFNAMGALHQREPGLAGAALDDERLTPTLIADLVHVHPALVRLAFARRLDLALVSDSVATGGAVVARDGAAYRTDGTLAGATALLDDAVASAVRVGIAPARAIEAATRIPAALVGADDRGRLDPGARADIVALDPRSFGVRAVWAAGRPVREQQ